MNGRRNRSRACALDRLEAWRRGGGALERGDRVLVAVGRGHARALGEPQRERGRRRRTGRRRLCAAAALQRRASRAPPRPRRSPAGRRRAAAARGARPIISVGAARCATISPWRVSRARTVRGGDAARAWPDRAAVSGPEPRTSTSMPESVAVTWMSSGLSAGLRISAIAQAARSRRRGRARGSDNGRSPPRGARGPPQSRLRARRARAAPGMEHGAAAAFAVGIDEVVDRRIDAGLRQRVDHERALPVAVTRRRPMLHGAAAAGAEMRTDRRDALGARVLDPHQMAAVGMAGPGVDLDGLAGQRVGHEDRPAGRRRRRRRRGGRGGR